MASSRAHAASPQDPRVGAELRSMRHLLEWQLSQLAWNDLTRRAPAVAELLKELTSMGLAAPLAADLLGELPDGIALEDAQLRVLGRLLGVECYALEDAAGLPQLLARLSGCRLVLIDTAGISPRDAALDARAAALCAVTDSIGAQIWMTLSAGAQAGVLEEAVQRFAAFRPAAVLLTKLDEATSLGGALSALATARLPISYVAEGPRIPEDLAPARPHQLVARAVYLAQSTDATAGDELLARKFGKVAHAFR